MAKTDKTQTSKKSDSKAARAGESVQGGFSIEEIVEAVNLAARAQTDAEIDAKKAAAKAKAKREALVELKAAAAAAALRAKRSAKELAVAQAAAKLAADEAKKAAKKVEKAAAAKKAAHKAAVKRAEQTRAARERLDAVPASDRGMVQLPPEPSPVPALEATSDEEYPSATATDGQVSPSSEFPREPGSDHYPTLTLPEGPGRHVRPDPDVTVSGE
jgi:hypothetical protein